MTRDLEWLCRLAWTKDSSLVGDMAASGETGGFKNVESTEPERRASVSLSLSHAGSSVASVLLVSCRVRL